MKRDKRLQILFTELEYNRLKSKAEKLGVPMAEVIRDFVKTLPEPGESEQPAKSIRDEYYQDYLARKRGDRQ